MTKDRIKFLLALLSLVIGLAFLYYVFRQQEQHVLETNLAEVSHLPAPWEPFHMPTHASSVSISLGSEIQAKGPNFKLECYTGLPFFLPLHVDNHSPSYLISGLEQRPGQTPPVNLGHRFFSISEHKLLGEGPRYFFTPALSPAQAGEQASQRLLSLALRCPEQAGSYLISIEIVQEGVAWQSDLLPKDGPYLKDLMIQAVPLNAPGPFRSTKPELSSVFLQRIEESSISPEIRHALMIALRLLETTAWKHNAQGYSYLLSEAGSQYPMAWVRDLATIQKAYFYLFDSKAWGQHHWTELFLYGQDLDGSIPDWLALSQPVDGLWLDKNTVSSDQELWLLESILSALGAKVIPLSWLKDMTLERPRWQRMQEAMSWLWQERFDAQEGCFWSGHTADWGDVGLLGKDSRTSTKIAYGGGRVCSLYTQALFLKVGKSLQALASQEPETFSSSFLNELQKFSEKVAVFLEKRLWQADRGFYRIHLHLDQAAVDLPAEDEIFALGGHVTAWEAGLLETNRYAMIIVEMLRRQKKFGYSTLGGVLSPPYPAQTFANPIMAPLAYQNGGQWDWWGARAALMLAQADPKAADIAFQEIAQKIIAHGTFYEWDHPDGSAGAGPHFRAGAAAFLYSISQHYGILSRR